VADVDATVDEVIKDDEDVFFVADGDRLVAEVNVLDEEVGIDI